MTGDRQVDPKGKITFRCGCGRHLRADASLAGRSARCVACGESLVIPESSLGDIMAVDSNDNLAKVTTDPAEEEQSVCPRQCGVCHSPILQGEQSVECSACHLPFHTDCWQENLGCSTYGCSQVNALKKGPDVHIGQVSAGSQSDDPSHQQRVWHYAINHQTFGPVSGVELAKHLSEERITSNTLVWKAGMASWQPINAIASLLPTNSSVCAVDGFKSQFPWELAVLAASAVLFLMSLLSYGIPSVLLLLGICSFGVVRLRTSKKPHNSIHWKCVGILVVACIISFAGFLTGLLLNID
jgi:hypothetical protein